ncbi:MAG: FCD domain-containing protein [Rhodospirillaceae bacterium]|nr:MAG: FCD domain-containing protein [Rhodospirillaceae bacterium]
MADVVNERSPPRNGDTRAADVLYRLRNDIVSCVLKPGDRLRFEALRDIYGVSFSTLREALARLSSERLVVAEGHRGFIVAPITRADLLDLTEARILVERECLARSIQNGDSAWEAEILSSFHRLDRLEMRMTDNFGVSPEWDLRHHEFHDSLVARAGSPILDEIRQSLFERARRYRRLSSITRKTPRAKSNEHRTLMEAVLASDIPRAQNLMEQHIRTTANNLLASVSDFVA